MALVGIRRTERIRRIGSDGSACAVVVRDVATAARNDRNADDRFVVTTAIAVIGCDIAIAIIGCAAGLAVDRASTAALASAARRRGA